MSAADDLYALPPGEFVAARNALAKELKAAGDKDAAAVVAKLPRPSVGAWALNQVARSDPDLIEASLEAGAVLKAASDAAMDGDASGLRAATAADRAAAAAVVKAAAPHLGARTESLRAGLTATLRVASLDEEVADRLRRGVLTSELEQPGFGFGAAAGEAPSTIRRTPARSTAKATRDGEPAAARPALRAVPDLPAEPPPDPEQQAREKAARAEARRAERERTKAREARQRTADRLAREAARLAGEADAAEEEARAARVAADAAAERAEAARRAVDEPPSG